jgi:DNA-3-methyladenine glycosylase
LVHDDASGTRVVAIVEVEAYRGREDPASHAYRGLTPRNAVMFAGGGQLYVYLIYGIHHCLNVVTGPVGLPHAVLLRAGAVVTGEPLIRQARGLAPTAAPRLVAGGPGRLAQALGIDRRHNATSLLAGPIRLTLGHPVAARDVAVGPRVGIDYAGEAVSWPLRFAVRDHPAVSLPSIEPSLGSGRGRASRAGSTGATTP